MTPTDPLTVYIAECGVYDSRYVCGVFTSPELAMAAMPGKRWVKTTWTSFDHRLPDRKPDLSRPRHWVTWENELDWDGAVSIQAETLVTDGPRREPDESRVQTYRESDGGWDYLPGGVEVTPTDPRPTP